jgi:hypothetical protein
MPRLHLGKVIVGAFLVPWLHRKAFARALAVPLALIVGFSVLWHVVPGLYTSPVALWLSIPIYGILFTLFAVTCHRLVLLDANQVARSWWPQWSRRETRFFSWIGLLWLSGVIAGLAVLTFLFNFSKFVIGTSDAAWLEYAVYGVQLPLLYAFARFCMLFPATALDRMASLRWSWDLTRDNGWKLVVVVGGLPFVFSVLVSFFYRSGATAAERLLLTAAAVALFAVEIAAVSLSYRELTRYDAIPPDGGASS